MNSRFENIMNQSVKERMNTKENVRNEMCTCTEWRVRCVQKEKLIVLLIQQITLTSSGWLLKQIAAFMQSLHEHSTCCIHLWIYWNGLDVNGNINRFLTEWGKNSQGVKKSILWKEFLMFYNSFELKICSFLKLE